MQIKAIVFFSLVSMLAAPVFCQTAPQRSEELCATLQQSASENGYSFRLTQPGFCAAEIDKGYTVLVSYIKEAVSVGLVIDVGVLNGDADAFWLRLSTFDNLASLALGTKQQAVFDKANKLQLQAAKAILPLVQQGQPDAVKEFHDTVQLALVTAFADAKGRITILAGADTKDIDKMKGQKEQVAGGGIASWRKVLALALLTFAAAARGYTNAYQAAQQRRPVTCYTNFQGITALTHCY
jgi:hypothetical protein